MFSRNYFVTLATLTLFYLFSRTRAIPQICQEIALESAVDCGCFLYRPLYESDQKWNRLKNLCLEALSGDLEAGNSSCKSAPFQVSLSPFPGVNEASVEAASQYFANVRRTCKSFERAQKMFERAKRRVHWLSQSQEQRVRKHWAESGGNRKELDENNEKRRKEFDEEHENRRKAFYEEHEKKKKELEEIYETHWNGVHDGYHPDFRSNSRNLSSSSPTTSSTSTSTVSHGLPERFRTVKGVSSHLKQELIRNQTNFPNSNTLRAESQLNVMSTVHLPRYSIKKKMGDFCFVVSAREGKLGKEAIRICCPEN